ncbi:MAG: cytochrome P450 [Alphaproteobacteria bacterium]|nr:cytochrome P450 [Alphaproteobacteria bacterium]
MTEISSCRMADLTAADAVARLDPHPRLAALRAVGPLHHDPAGGAWLVPRMRDARTILTDRSHGKNPDKADASAISIRRRRATVPDGLAFPDDQRASILELDDPDHARIRTPLVQALLARVAAFEPQAGRIVDAALDRLAGRTHFDLMAEIAEPVPVSCIGAILGVPDDLLPSFRAWLDGIVQTFNPNRTDHEIAALVAASNGLGAFIRESFADRKLHPRDDLFSDMARLQAGGAPLTDVEITYNLRGLLIAGNVTTTDLIGNAARLVLTHPSQRARLDADPLLWSSAVEETLRYDPPVDFTWRVAGRDLDLSGCPVARGAALNVFLRSANRDAAAFERPDTFDIARNPCRHLAFGGGSHICPGAPLARIEARLVLSKLFACFPRLCLCDPDAPPLWRALPGFRGLERLDVRVD